jgi:peroxiredoxin
MVSEGDTAPSIAATYEGSDHEDFDLADHLGDGPVVLAFFPGAFTPPCTNEMVGLQEHFAQFEESGATLFGISADSAFAQEAFAEEYDLAFDLVSDTRGDAIEAYGLSIDIPDLGMYGVANRAVFVLDEDGTVTYRWIAEEPGNEPDYDELLEAVRAV